MPIGVVLALLAYGLYACADTLIKGIGTSLPVFEIAFFATLFSLLPAVLSKPAGESWVKLWQMQHPWLVQLRALSGLFGSLCMVYALTHIRIAEAYSLVFLTPVFAVMLSALMLGEQVGWQRWVLLSFSFIGVLLVVQPGFRELALGHMAALAGAFFGAVSVTVLRFVSTKEKRVSLVGVVATYALVFNFFMMLPVFRVPSVEQFLLLATVGAFGGTAHILFITAARTVAANHLAPVQYTQLIWGVIFSAILYWEVPNPLGMLGLLVIASAGVLNVLWQQKASEPRGSVSLPLDLDLEPNSIPSKGRAAAPGPIGARAPRP